LLLFSESVVPVTQLVSYTQATTCPNPENGRYWLPREGPPIIPEEDMRKLTALLEQLEIIGEAEKKLEAKTGTN
jgi:hypothetical protein